MDERTPRYVERLDASRRRPLVEQLEDDVASYRNLTPAQRSATVDAVLRAGREVLRVRPDFRQAIAWRDPPAPDFPALWARLMERRRAQREGR